MGVELTPKRSLNGHIDLATVGASDHAVVDRLWRTVSWVLGEPVAVLDVVGVTALPDIVDRNSSDSGDGDFRFAFDRPLLRLDASVAILDIRLPVRRSTVTAQVDRDRPTWSRDGATTRPTNDTSLVLSYERRSTTDSRPGG